MFLITTRAVLLLSLLLALNGCVVAPKIQLKSSDTTMALKNKVPVVTVVDYAPDGKSIATGGMGGAARIWDIASAKEAVKFKHPAEKLIVKGLSFSPDGKSLAVSTHGLTKFTPHVTTLWDVSTGAQTKTYAENFGGRLSFSPDGKFLLGQIGGFSGGALNLLDIQSGVLVLNAGAESSLGQAGFDGQISPDGKYVFSWGAEIKTLISFPVFSARLIEIATGKEVWKKPIKCDEATFSPDGKKLLLSLHTFSARRAGQSENLVQVI
jgi:Tol biopolymer transport system component